MSRRFAPVGLEKNGTAALFDGRTPVLGLGFPAVKEWAAGIWATEE
jgi:hypothetical protein